MSSLGSDNYELDRDLERLKTDAAKMQGDAGESRGYAREQNHDVIYSLAALAIILVLIWLAYAWFARNWSYALLVVPFVIVIAYIPFHLARDRQKLRQMQEEQYRQFASAKTNQSDGGTG